MPRRSGRSRFSARSACLTAAVILSALAVIAVGSGSSAALFRRLSPTAPPAAAPRDDSARAAEATATLPQLRASIPGLVSTLAFQAAPPEAITIYAANCTTPKSSFNTGDTVCVKRSGTSIGTRNIYWVSPEGFVVQKDSAASTAPPATRVVSAPGIWKAYLVTGGEPAVRLIAAFSVSDPQRATADLAVYKAADRTISSFAPGTSATYRITVANQGPDDAKNVAFIEGVPNDTILLSSNQDSGPAFSCSPNNTGTATVCTIATLSAGSVATFTFVYEVGASVAAGTLISNTATVASLPIFNNDGELVQAATDELHEGDNSSTDEHPVIASPCVLSCPADIHVTAPAGSGGAVVTYTVQTNGSNCGSSLSYSVPSGSVFPVGTTTVTAVGATGDACSFLVTVDSPGGLFITLNGPNPATVECRDGFDDPGAEAHDGTNQPVPVTVSGSFNPNTPGTYTLTYTATDGTNSVSTTRTVIVSDTSPPVITIAGANPMTLSCGQPFVDPGASAVDECSGLPVTVTTSGTVDAATPGTYTITYTATDGVNTPATATRTVNVEGVGDSPPTITLNGDETMTVECATGFTDPGATAVAACTGVSVPVTVSGTVDMSTPGSYDLVYTATANGHTADITRTVIVEDHTAPVITLNGAATMTVECHTSFTDPGATANDGCAGSQPVTASGTVDPNTVGVYTITYTATDPAGNVATATRTVNVVDTTAPTISGVSDVTANTGAGATSCGTVVSDATLGTASASDGCAGSVSVTRSGVPAGNVFPVGSTTVTYTATDPSGNTTTKTQTVTVVDNTAPTVNVPANIVVTLAPNTTATSMTVTYSVTASDNCPGVTLNVSPASGSTFSVGTTTVTATATDAHSNVTTRTFTVTVLYNFTGFFSPVSNLPTLNSVNAGRAIPVKFSLSGNKGLGIMAADSPASQQITCDTSAPISNLEETTTAGNSSLSYSPDQYNYTWKTESSWAGTCRQLVVTLNDGSTHVAKFKFK